MNKYPFISTALIFSVLLIATSYSVNADTFDNKRAAAITAFPAGTGLVTCGGAGVAPVPVAAVNFAALKLLAGDDIDALSFGDDEELAWENHQIVFSVDAAAKGAPGSGVDNEVLIGTAPSLGAGAPEACGDLFVQLDPPIGCSNVLAPRLFGYTCGTLTGDEHNAAWQTPSAATADDLDAFDYTSPAQAQNLGCYFSLVVGSPTLAAIGATAGDILFSPADGVTLPVIAMLAADPANAIAAIPATAVNLGIDGDDLDALNVIGDNQGTIALGSVAQTKCSELMLASTHLVQYSVAPGSVNASCGGLTIEPGDVLDPGGPAAGGPCAEIHTLGAKLGLLSFRANPEDQSDNLNALEAKFTPERIPAVSQWGLAALVLLVLSAGTIVILRQRKTATV